MSIKLLNEMKVHIDIKYSFINLEYFDEDISIYDSKWIKNLLEITNLDLEDIRFKKLILSVLN